MESIPNPTGSEALRGKTTGDISVLLSRYRTTLSFQRTRLSADRTLMSVIRTALSMIGFGFTIFHFFHALKKVKNMNVDPTQAAESVGLAMVGMGILMLLLGIIYHAIFMLQVRKERERLNAEGFIAKHDSFPVSMTLIVAVLLLLLGVFVILRMVVSYS
jgi:putative membrane protein